MAADNTWNPEWAAGDGCSDPPSGREADSATVSSEWAAMNVNREDKETSLDPMCIADQSMEPRSSDIAEEDIGVS